MKKGFLNGTVFWLESIISAEFTEFSAFYTVKQTTIFGLLMSMHKCPLWFQNMHHLYANFAKTALNKKVGWES